MGVILAPVNGRGVATRLERAGARELYMGFHDPEWTKKFGEGATLNRMSGFGQEANTLSFDELVDEVDSAELHASLFCVFNAAGYSSQQVDYIASRYLPRLAAAGFTGIIVSGEELISAVHAQSMIAVASTMCAIYNEDLARYYAHCGIDRAILPRDVTLDDIASVTSAVPELRYEAFFMRNGCIFADSHCMGLHKAGCPSTCLALRTSRSYNQYPTWGITPTTDGFDPWAFEENDQTYRNDFHYSACGLCALWRMEQLGIDAYKVVGRGDDVSELESDVALCARNLEIARTCATEEEYLARMERPDGILELCEMRGLSCYYPEVRFGKGL